MFHIRRTQIDAIISWEVDKVELFLDSDMFRWWSSHELRRNVIKHTGCLVVIQCQHVCAPDAWAECIGGQLAPRQLL